MARIRVRCSPCSRLHLVGTPAGTAPEYWVCIARGCGHLQPPTTNPAPAPKE